MQESESESELLKVEVWKMQSLEHSPSKTSSYSTIRFLPLQEVKRSRFVE